MFRAGGIIHGYPSFIILVFPLISLSPHPLWCPHSLHLIQSHSSIFLFYPVILFSSFLSSFSELFLFVCFCFCFCCCCCCCCCCCVLGEEIFASWHLGSQARVPHQGQCLCCDKSVNTFLVIAFEKASSVSARSQHKVGKLSPVCDFLVCVLWLLLCFGFLSLSLISLAKSFSASA